MLDKQYNKNAEKFTKAYNNDESYVSRNLFFSIITEEIISLIKNKKVLDLGCGSGIDADFYVKKGLLYYGVDSSFEMCNLANKNNLVQEVKNESFSETMSFDDKSFGLVVSKYAIQTATKITPVYNEVYRILDDDGYFIFLVVHPIRQFIEKKKPQKDYFKKELVESIIFNGKITVTEPSHTLNEYLNQDFFRKFSLVDFREDQDFPASEQINNENYPTFLIIVAQKKTSQHIT